MGSGALLWWLLAAPPPRDSSRYVEAYVGDPPPLNPLLVRPGQRGAELLPLIYRSLARADVSGTVWPDLATWQVSEDGLEYTIQMQQGVTWHDGAPVSADDVMFTVALLRRMEDDGGEEGSFWQDVELETHDPLRVVARLSQPLASFPDHLTFFVLPRHALAEITTENLLNHPFNQRPIGTGAYRVRAFDPAALVLEAPSESAASIKTVEVRFVATSAAALSLARAGQVDGVSNVTYSLSEQLATATTQAAYEIPERAKLALLALNTRAGPFAKASARKAANLGIDRETVVLRALGGHAEPAEGPIPRQSWAFWRSDNVMSHDPAAAVTLLEEDGWRLAADGVRETREGRLAFTLLTDDSDERLAVAGELARQLGAIGFAVRIRPLPADELEENYLATGQFEAALIGQRQPGADPDPYPQWHSSQARGQGANISGLQDADIDRLLERGRQTTDPGERLDAYIHFQARWLEEQPVIPLYHPVYRFTANRELRGISALPVPDASWRLRDVATWRWERPVTARQRWAQGLKRIIGAP
ncbi:MAG: peptide ABC transporter substrate-binding protein [Chloroflexota bacterium]